MGKKKKEGEGQEEKKSQSWPGQFSPGPYDRVEDELAEIGGGAVGITLARYIDDLRTCLKADEITFKAKGGKETILHGLGKRPRAMGIKSLKCPRSGTTVKPGECVIEGYDDTSIAVSSLKDTEVTLLCWKASKYQ